MGEVQRTPGSGFSNLLPGESPTIRLTPPASHRDNVGSAVSQEAHHTLSTRVFLGLVTWALSPAGTQFQTLRGKQVFSRSHVT